MVSGLPLAACVLSSESYFKGVNVTYAPSRCQKDVGPIGMVPTASSLTFPSGFLLLQPHFQCVWQRLKIAKYWLFLSG